MFVNPCTTYLDVNQCCPQPLQADMASDLSQLCLEPVLHIDRLEASQLSLQPGPGQPLLSNNFLQASQSALDLNETQLGLIHLLFFKEESILLFFFLINLLI